MEPSAPQVYTWPLRVAMPMMSPLASFTSRTRRGTARVRSHCRSVLHPALHHMRALSSHCKQFLLTLQLSDIYHRVPALLMTAKSSS